MILSDRNRNCFDSLMRNEQPDGVCIATAPRIDMWKSIVSVERHGQHLIRLEGEVHGSPEYHDGESILTSPVIWIDRANGWARTTSRIYRLDGSVIDEDVEP